MSSEPQSDVVSSPPSVSSARQAALRARYDAGRAAWPAVSLPFDEFADYLALRSTGIELAPVERAADLYLACACALGDSAALQAFRRTYGGDIARAASRIDPSPAFADDVTQAVSERLFVRTGEAAPRIAEYEGRASLRGWVGSVAKRIALNARRSKSDRPHDPLSSTTGDAALAVGPELALLKARFKPEFEAGIRAAMAKLPTKDRTLLLLHLVDHVTLPQLAAIQKVSRATVARWLASAREALHEGTRRELNERLRLSPSEIESAAALVRSELELSFGSAMRDINIAVAPESA